MNKIRVQQEDFSVEQEMAHISTGRTDIGALVNFIGLVRDLNDDTRVSTMTLEHYPGMTEKQLASIVDEAESRWPLQAVTVIHRIGKLQPGEQIVLVITASMHRGDAFEANSFIMDYLKKRATFWKKESRPGEDHWVEERESDVEAIKRWNG
ncbi:MAG TPA: molybdopterin synthase catalytic subunit MoaE [Gammaproteobacteria bacterium]|nr:molybdopterin synthase catalytic subunit MoaE [Gammaproteobacteria bacterium]